ncbi:MAG: repair protein NreA [Candidatus Woesearchaeota archaeon]|nr:repair protein NreA [Candidatus Woesearchaeota archaeon]
MDIKCVFCKGRLYCGRPFCPIAAKIKHMEKRASSLKQEYEAEAPNIFVGRYGYPNVNVGVLSVEHYKDNDEPKKWAKDYYSINQIIGLREELINSGKKLSVHSAKVNPSNLVKNQGSERLKDSAEHDELSKLKQELQDISMAQKPSNVEVKLTDVPKPKLSFNQHLAPTNIMAGLSSLKIISNPDIKKATYAVNDADDMKAEDAIEYLMKKNYDEYSIQKLLAGGVLGSKEERRFVPTRWAITATDDIMGKKIKERINDNPELDYTLFFGGYLGNYYIILFFPAPFSYELYEMAIEQDNADKRFKGIVPKYMHDYEGFKGRKDYAYDTAGGYYAARLSILKKLDSIKKRASVLALRFVTKEYWAPLGVWVVREAVGKALDSRGVKFASKELMLEYAASLSFRKYNVDLKRLLANSFILNNILKQRTLKDFEMNS